MRFFYKSSPLKYEGFFNFNNMCLTVRNSKIYEAKEDIICYKYLTLSNGSTTIFRSAVQGFKYIQGNIYSHKKGFPKKVEKSQKLFGGGFHSYIAQRSIREHILEEAPRISQFSRTVAVKCIIPKGSKYIIGSQNRKGQYFSSKIIISKILVRRKVKAKQLELS